MTIKDTVSDYGVLYLATGRPWYLALTACSALSLRLSGFSGPIAVLTDLVGADRSVFSESAAELIPVVVPACGVRPSRWIKTRLDRYTPFDRTLFLDCDVVALNSPDLLWQAAGDSEFAIVRDAGVENAPNGDRFRTVGGCDHGMREEIDYTCRIVDPMSIQYNTGIMAWRSGAVAERLFSRWNEEWQRYQDIDQLAFVRAITIEAYTPHLLADRFNYPWIRPMNGLIRDSTVFWHLYSDRVDPVFRMLFGRIYTNAIDTLEK